MQNSSPVTYLTRGKQRQLPGGVIYFYGLTHATDVAGDCQVFGYRLRNQYKRVRFTVNRKWYMISVIQGWTKYFG